MHLLESTVQTSVSYNNQWNLLTVVVKVNAKSEYCCSPSESPLWHSLPSEAVTKDCLITSTGEAPGDFRRTAGRSKAVRDSIKRACTLRVNRLVCTQVDDGKQSLSSGLWIRSEENESRVEENWPRLKGQCAPWQINTRVCSALL